MRGDGEIHPRPISTVRAVQLQKLAMETGIHIYVWCLIFEWRQNNLVPNVRKYFTKSNRVKSGVSVWPSRRKREYFLPRVTTLVNYKKGARGSSRGNSYGRANFTLLWSQGRIAKYQKSGIFLAKIRIFGKNTQIRTKQKLWIVSKTWAKSPEISVYKW